MPKEMVQQVTSYYLVSPQYILENKNIASPLIRKSHQVMEGCVLIQLTCHHLCWQTCALADSH